VTQFTEHVKEEAATGYHPLVVCFYGDLETNYRVIVAVEFCCTSEKLLVQTLKNDLDLYSLIKFKLNATAIMAPDIC